MQLQTATISAYLLWWVQEPVSMTWTKGAALPCTTLLLLILMESELQNRLHLFVYIKGEQHLSNYYMSSLALDIVSLFLAGAWSIC